VDLAHAPKINCDPWQPGRL